MTPRSVRRWAWVHRWSSLVCTVFALLLCLTGLPLVFHDELGPNPTLADVPPDLPPDLPPASVDAMIAQALAARPGHVVPYLFFDRDRPIVKVPTAPSMTTEPSSFHYRVFDTRTGAALDAAQPNEGFMYVMLRLHVDLFAGVPGTLFLGGMGLLLVVAIVSGVVLYGPFTRRLDFGTVRRDGSRRLKWLDLHNLLGIVTLAWFAVVTLTGVINTLAAPIELAWQAGQLVEMAAQAKPLRSDGERASVDALLRNVRDAVPDMAVTTVAFPGTPFSTDAHVAIFLTGDTPITSRILKPALADAATGRVVAVRDMPWYATMLFMSQPLHFGDYGGLPLKILWALLDVATIVVLASGLYLWWPGRRRVPGDAAVRLDRAAGPARVEVGR
ncbi:PepSY domain-containing protein [Rhodoplanes sp. TEM]|uniref:PepSY domain-containing protein n=1 Tax=Rhodoplanes tepidamans TaxID=200616 RepID=A0ABT5JJF9_RHOTP|nr:MULTISPECIES: PepSY domain-containing protein [Rhodoplanes]MDC7789850.1 PepSY domain-containing protein [Rhodoplanes tepidamans]MDC7987784.1 PepSY domain-containing protein [Rhodoplanes sp. TEM]MDQ0358501.1 putative iron-regulated membrane protein [Rhodoplanes tepidamans]